jgi:hypothetical protein
MFISIGQYDAAVFWVTFFMGMLDSLSVAPMIIDISKEELDSLVPL